MRGFVATRCISAPPGCQFATTPHVECCDQATVVAGNAARDVTRTTGLYATVRLLVPAAFLRAGRIIGGIENLDNIGTGVFAAEGYAMTSRIGSASWTPVSF
jgi:hypothetical protein